MGREAVGGSVKERGAPAAHRMLGVAWWNASLAFHTHITRRKSYHHTHSKQTFQILMGLGRSPVAMIWLSWCPRCDLPFTLTHFLERARHSGQRPLPAGRSIRELQLGARFWVVSKQPILKWGETGLQSFEGYFHCVNVSVLCACEWETSCEDIERSTHLKRLVRLS